MADDVSQATDARLSGERSLLWWRRKKKREEPVADAFYDENTAKSTREPEVLRRIVSYNRDDTVAVAALQNPFCPEDLVEAEVKKGLEKGEANNRMLAALRNPRCPPYVLAEVVRRKVADVATREALKSANIPVGVILEADQDCEDDDLKTMLVASPNCPAELINKAARGDRTRQSVIEALKRDAITEETLRHVIGVNFESDPASFVALKHRKIGAEIIAAILSRGCDDEISRWAAAHSKCPVPSMREFLARKQNDKVSHLLAWRRELPRDLRVKWMEDTGQLKKQG